jgi:tetratricopeptide (TPR) repeat protein
MKILVNRWFAKYSFLNFVIALVLGVSGCASNQPKDVPDAEVLQRMKPIEARGVLQNTHILLSRTAFEEGISITSIKVDAHKNLVLHAKNGGTYSLSLSNLTVSAGTCCLGTWAVVDLNDNWRLWGIPPDEEGLNRVKRIADAILVIKQTALNRDLNETENSARFEEIAKTYKQATTKPTLSEEARRFKVQAEGAVHDKKFNDAADLYEQALEAAPWWPEGHFNRALLLSETGEFLDAIAEMKRYLALVPDAPDARAAQDKIYDWERKAGTPN